MLYKNIPWYFRESELYRSFDEDDINADIDIHEELYFYYKNINNVKDLPGVLKIMQYWGFDEIPIELLDFIDKNPEDSLNYLYTQKEDLKLQNVLKDLLEVLIPKNDILRHTCLDFSFLVFLFTFLKLIYFLYVF